MSRLLPPPLLVCHHRERDKLMSSHVHAYTYLMQASRNKEQNKSFTMCGVCIISAKYTEVAMLTTMLTDVYVIICHHLGLL